MRFLFHILQVLQEFRREMDKAEIPSRASLVLLVACTGQHPIISDEDLDAFAAIGHALAPEKVLENQEQRVGTSDPATVTRSSRKRLWDLWPLRVCGCLHRSGCERMTLQAT